MSQPQPQTSDATSSSYVFVPSTAAVTISAELYMTYVYTQGLISYTQQIVTELSAQMKFAQTSADDTVEAGKQQEMQYIIQGAGEMFSGALQAGAGFSNTAEKEEPLLDVPEKPETFSSIEENRTAMELDGEQLPTQQEYDEQVSEINDKNDGIKKRNQQVQQRNSALDSSRSAIFRGIGEAGKGATTATSGYFKNNEAKYNADKTLQDVGQQNASTMISNYMEQYNSLVGVMNQIYQIISQIAQANSLS